VRPSSASSKPADPALLPIQTPTYYINLASSTERDATIRRNFGSLARALTRVPAVTSSDKWYIDAVKKYNFEQVLADDPNARSTLSITMSHIRAIATAFDATSGQGDDAMALIMEDDISLDLLPMWSSSLEQYAQGLPKGWMASQVGYTDSSWTNKYHRDTQTSVEMGGARHGGGGSTEWGAFAYLISRRGMKAVLDLSRDRLSGLPNLSMLVKRCGVNVGLVVADDCLLGFAPRTAGQGSPPFAQNVYLAVPPFFTVSPVNALASGTTVLGRQDNTWHRSAALLGYCYALHSAVTACRCPPFASVAGRERYRRNRCGPGIGAGASCDEERAPCCIAGWCASKTACENRNKELTLLSNQAVQKELFSASQGSAWLREVRIHDRARIPQHCLPNQNPDARKGWGPSSGRSVRRGRDTGDVYSQAQEKLLWADLTELGKVTQHRIGGMHTH
jgi:GR25 family glycosyltransferase involved in LPS biosynthesis